MRKLEVGNIRTANPVAVKQVNRTVVLNLVRQLQPIARTELAEVSGLNRSTVTDIVKELLDEGLLVEAGLKESRGGRRAVQLRLNAPNIRCVVIDVGVRESSIIIGDVDGNRERLATFATPREPSEFMGRCFDELDRVLLPAPPAAFRGITVSVPGLVDRVSGRVRLGPNLGWRDMELGALLQRRYSLPVYVENEAKLSAIAQMWTEGVQAAENYAFVSVTEGIGVGLVIGNKLYRGFDGAAGEFGHMTIQIDGPRCGCGRRGCWETLASEAAAARHYAGCPNGGFGALPGADLPDFDEVVTRAREGEERARVALEQMGRYLGIGIANIVNGLNLKLVIVGGRVTRAWDIVGPVLSTEAERQVLPSCAVGLRVEPSTLEDASVTGAVVQAVSSVFSGITLG